MAGRYFWHIVANIDTEYDSVQECMEAFKTGEGRFRPFLPYVPVTRMPDEDAATYRLPVCAKLEECFSAIGLLGRFRRCLAANEDAFSYVEAGGEIYPILVCKFDGALPVHIPSKEEVPDAEETGELWLLQQAEPVDIQMEWLDPYSIIWNDENGRICKSVKFVREDDLENKVHPWLTGTGNILESSLMDYAWRESLYRKPWADTEVRDIKEAFFADKMPVRAIQCRIVPYRSTREIISLLSDKSAEMV